MKRKMLAVTMVSMLLCLSGCNSVNESSESQSAPTESSAPIETTAPVETAAPDETTVSNEIAAPDESQMEQETVTYGYLDVTFDYTYDSYYDEVSLMYGHYNTIELHNDDYPELTKAVKEFNQTHTEKMQEYLDGLKQCSMDDYKDFGQESFHGPYVWEGDMSIRRADSQVLSVVENCYDYAGGAHGTSYYSSLNLDVQTGEEIKLESVIADKNSLPGILETELMEKYSDTSFWGESLANLLQDYIKPQDTMYAPEFTWTLDYEGVTFYFGSYEIASYADGTQQVTLTYSEYPQLFEEVYFKNVGQDYVVKLSDSWLGSDTDLNGDGVTDYISVSRNYNADMGFDEFYSITVNGNAYTQDTHFYDLDVYLVKSAGDNYLYAQRTIENDYKLVCVYKITKDSIAYVGEFSGSIESFTNSLDFRISKRLDMLSTYFGMVDCYVDANGMPVEKSGIYEVRTEMSITSTVEITAELVDEEGNLTGASYTFPAGTSFTFKKSDGATFVDMMADDGQWCRFYTAPKWPPTVNGMDAESSFEMLWYAG